MTIWRLHALAPRLAWPAMFVFALLLAVPATAEAQIEPDEAVSSGADALDGWSDYPWYDSSTDDVRRIKIRIKPQPQPSSLPNWSLGDFEWLGWTLIAAVVAVLLFLLVRAYLNRDALREGAAGARMVGAPSNIDRLEELPFQLETPVTDLLTAAAQAYGRGDYNQAIILLYSHELLELDKHDVLRLTKGKTNRQYLRELRHQPALAEMLDVSMVAFEDVFFGSHTLARERFERCWRLATERLPTLRQPQRGAA